MRLTVVLSLLLASTVFALDVMPDLAPSATPETILAAMNGHVIASGECVGSFQR